MKSLLTSKRSILLLSLFVLSSNFAQADTTKQSAIVDQAVTGDTVRLKSGKLLKYIGVDAPDVENKNPAIRQVANESQAFNNALTADKEVWIEWGAKLRDNQNRLLGYVFLQDGTFINQKILEAGHAKVRIKSPNLKYAVELKNAESSAHSAKRGLWEKDLSEFSPQKQLIGEKNTKIYYLPNSPELDRIPEAQWVYFSSRLDAKAAGYRACATCRETSDTPDED